MRMRGGRVESSKGQEDGAKDGGEGEMALSVGVLVSG